MGDTKMKTSIFSPFRIYSISKSEQDFKYVFRPDLAYTKRDDPDRKERASFRHYLVT